MRLLGGFGRSLRGQWIGGERRQWRLFITLEEPTGPMRTEAVSAGYYRSEIWQRDYPKIQIRTVGELLAGQGFELPSFEAAQRHREEGEQGRLGRELVMESGRWVPAFAGMTGWLLGDCDV